MLTDQERKTLKVKVGLAVKLAGGQENAANITSRITRHATFSDYGNTKVPDRHTPVDVAVEIDQFNGKPLIVAKMAELLGYKLVSMPSPHASAAEIGTLARSIKEGAEAVAALSEKLAFGLHPSKAIDAKVLREIDEAIEAFLEARARLAPSEIFEIGGTE